MIILDLFGVSSVSVVMKVLNHDFVYKTAYTY